MLRPVTGYHSVFVGAAAATAVWISVFAGLPVWAVFLGWALYFVLCSGVRTALLTAIQIIAGLILGAALVYVNGRWAPAIGVCSMMILAFIFGSSFVFVEGMAPLNSIPAYYFGAIEMIASGFAPQVKPVVLLAVSIILGLTLGWMTVWGRTRLSEMVAARPTASLRPPLQ